MNDAFDRILHATRRRPVRVVEAALALAAALGIGLTDSAEAQVVAIVTALVGLIGGEIAQHRTAPWEPGTVVVRPSSSDLDDVGDPPENVATKTPDNQ